MLIAIAKVLKDKESSQDFCWPIFNQSDIIEAIDFMKKLDIKGII